MDNYYKALVVIPLVVLLGLGALYFFLNSSSKPSTYQNQLSTVPVESSGVADTSKVAVGTKEISAGSEFSKVEGGVIYYTEDGDSKSATLSTDEVVIACTEQDLIGLTKLDFDRVVSIDLVTPTDLNDRIDSGTPVVIIANSDDGEYIAHTIAVNDLELCE